MALSGVPPEQRLLFGNTRGLPWWGSLVLALGLALVAAIAELMLSDSVGRVFEGASFIGCVAAVCLARRNSLFCPMVQPPLIVGLVGPAVMFVLGDVDGGTRARLIAVANPLINSFPAMAVTTGVTLAIGIGRLVHARRSRARSTELRDEERGDGGRRRKPPEREQRSGGRRPSGKTASRPQQRPAGSSTSSGEHKKPSPQQREATTRKQPPPRGGSGARREPPERDRRGGKPRRPDDSGRNPRPRPGEGQRQGQQRKPRRRPDDE